MKSPPIRGRAAGFTLVEVMLTTVLAAVLLVALWSLLSMYSKAFEGGNARTEQSQLGRALFDQISADLQNVLVSPNPPTQPVGILPPGDVPFGSPPNAGASVSRSADVTPTPPATTSIVSATAPHVPPSTENVTAPSPIGRPSARPEVSTSSLRPPGLFGTSTYLQVDVVQPAMISPVKKPNEEALADPEAPPSADELRTVTYSFEEYRSPTDLQSVPGTRLVRRELSWPEAHPVRSTRGGTTTQSSTDAVPLVVDDQSFSTGREPFEQDRQRSNPTTSFTVEPNVEGTDELETYDPTTTSVPEVLDFALRYYDGATWADEWDSVARGGLPVAVEVMMRLRSYDEPESPSVIEAADNPGVDREKVEQWKHPEQRLLIPIRLAVKTHHDGALPNSPSKAEPPHFPGADIHAGFNQ